MRPEDREWVITGLFRFTKRQLAERLVDTRSELADACQRVADLLEENRQLREQFGIERGRRSE